jgi:dihydrofolate synthase / folylpolyglutamate synthase
VSADAVSWLFGLAQFGIKFGLHNIQALVSELGHPERSFRSIHVAGTNGKGSVTAILNAALIHAGYRTGRYTSPHLLDLSERFAVNGTPVGHAEMLSAVDDVRSAVERLQNRGTLDVHPTFFEVTTAVAFELFRRYAVDFAVCEVGLGGRLDATNVLTPMVSAITSISFDHEQYLGHTLREIAGEKAGIIKPGTPLVVGPMPEEASRAIATRARESSAPLTWAVDGTAVSNTVVHTDGQRFHLRTAARDYGEVHLALAGAHQITNAVIAVRILEQLEASGVAIGPVAITQALATVRWPGRLERVQLAGGRDVLLDAAHNAAGAEALATHLRTFEARRPLVFAAMRDKDVESMLRALAPAVSSIVVTRASNPRAADPAELAAVARRIAPASRIDVVEAPAAALDLAWSRSPQIVVAGSIFLLADIMKLLERT